MFRFIFKLLRLVLVTVLGAAVAGAVADGYKPADNTLEVLADRLRRFPQVRA